MIPTPLPTPIPGSLRAARRPRPRGRARPGPLAGAALALAAACSFPPPGAQRPSVPGSVPRAAAALPWAGPAPEAIAVRLAEAEGTELLVLEGARGELRVERAGPLVRASDGQSGERIAVEPAPGGVVRLAGRAHPGPVHVQAAASGGLEAIAHVPLEEYVAGVVAAELVLWSAHPAALEAQAIAARSYALSALRARGPGGVLFGDTRDQVYRGRFEPTADAGSRSAAERLAAAVSRTRGLYLLRGGDVLDARFHAACGGHTAAFADIFPREAPDWALRFAGTAACGPCARIAAAEEGTLEGPEARGQVRWTYTADRAELEGLAGGLGLGERLSALRPARVDAHGRWLSCELVGERGAAELELGELRRRLGHARLRSGRIVRTWPGLTEPITAGLFLEGLGRGHGVGLCQVGAGELAAAGWSAEAILAHYYPIARPGRLPAEPRR